MAAASPGSIARSPGPPTRRSCRSESTRCSSTRSAPPTASRSRSCSRSCSPRPQGRRVRRLAYQHRRGRPVRQRLRRREPQLEDPALLDRSGPEPVRVFESGAILLYLAEKFGAFLPTEPAPRAECLSWLFWQMGSAPYLGGGFGHFYAYAPSKMRIPDRSLRHGGEAPARRARPPSGRAPLPGRRRLHHRRHGGALADLALVRRAAPRPPGEGGPRRSCPSATAPPT
jgi:hypothetical protein